MDRPRHRKKLIEVALPLEAINRASAKEKSIRHGHPSTLHLWWARRPLAAARAVIFAQMVDDPSANPDLFPTVKAQEKERQRLFRIIESLVLWENTANDAVLQAARDEIWQSWRRACAENAGHPEAKALFDRTRLPAFHDPFAGGGSLPLEAQRLGLEVTASDLNPVAVLINKAMVEIPAKLKGLPPVNLRARKSEHLFDRPWAGAQGLADDVRHYGKWMRDEAEKRIGQFYPRVVVTAEMAGDRRDLEPLVGYELPVVAWLWVRTVKSPDPAFLGTDVPLASTFILSTRVGREAYIEPAIHGNGYRFTVKIGTPKAGEGVEMGTRLARGAHFRCLLSGTPIPASYVRAEGQARRIGSRLMAIVLESPAGRVYVGPNADHESLASKATSAWRPDVDFYQHALGFRIGGYGMTRWSDVFTERQLLALSTFSELAREAQDYIERDALESGMSPGEGSLASGPVCARAYAQAVRVYLSFAISKAADRNSALCVWEQKMERLRGTFGRQALPMVWDYVETNPFAGAGGDVYGTVRSVCEALENLGGGIPGRALQCDARVQALSSGCVVSTDPPYYDNIGYSDLSDFFYVWLRPSLSSVFPELFGTLAVPKAEELVATPIRHGSKEEAGTFFLDGMTRALRNLADQAHPDYPVTIYYAFKQSESSAESGTTSTGWETFLDAVIRAGFSTSGTWPIRTELGSRMRGMASNALATSIVLVCRRRHASAPTATRRELVTALRAELPLALAHLQRGNIAPVDLAQAAIGPGMAVYTRFARVLDAKGQDVTVRDALALINEILDESLAEQEGDFDSDTRWALTWFEQLGFAEGEYGIAEQLSKSKNTSVAGMVQAGILESKRGKVRLLRPSDLRAGWTPETDERFTAWETVHYLIRALESGGESAASTLLSKAGARAEVARELAYRLYALCERKKRPAEALSYNGLVQSWPEIARLTQGEGRVEPEAGELFGKDE